MEFLISKYEGTDYDPQAHITIGLPEVALLRDAVTRLRDYALSMTYEDIKTWVDLVLFVNSAEDELRKAVEAKKKEVEL